jgi:hypothetical protein
MQPRITETIRCPAWLADRLNKMTDAERDAFVARALHKHLKAQP